MYDIITSHLHRDKARREVAHRAKNSFSLPLWEDTWDRWWSELEPISDIKWNIQLCMKIKQS